jgi:hypothetical protein
VAAAAVVVRKWRREIAGRGSVIALSLHRRRYRGRIVE